LPPPAGGVFLPLPLGEGQGEGRAEATSRSSSLSLRERGGAWGVLKPALDLLSRFWLHEPDPETLALAHEVPSLALHIGDARELSTAYTELFLLNVYPYGTAFTDPSGELNGPSAWRTARRYETHGYSPPELSEAGAPDHVGLCLGFLSHLTARELSDIEFSCWLLDWVPVCCLAVEREPSAHPFYRALAARTREGLMEDIPVRLPLDRENVPAGEVEEEVHLSDVIRFLLAPARSGFFLSRSRLGRLARSAGLRLSFASRFEVAQTLFASAGESGDVEAVLESLAAEVAEWKNAYRAWTAESPAWTPYATRWLCRIGETERKLGEMREILENPPELEYANW